MNAGQSPKRTRKPRQSKARGTTEEVTALRFELRNAYELKDKSGHIAGHAKCGIYAFYDYDGEPIYVGQTREGVRTRINRHLTNQRSDAVAMGVLDPFEVAEIEMWPFWNLETLNASSIKSTLNSGEYTVYRKLLNESTFKALLNEAIPAPAPLIDLPESTRARIVPEHIFERSNHPDVRIARRANTIAKLASRISERQVEPGLRNTLVVQSQRLEYLAKTRLKELGGVSISSESLIDEDESVN